MRIIFNKNNQAAFTLVELLLTIAVVGILASLALSSYRSYLEKTDIAVAMSDIVMIDSLLQTHHGALHSYPNDLSSFNLENDPWGNPYVYLNMSLVTGHGLKRKDRNLVPINSDYDLYSKGPDGQSALALTAAFSQDDIVRANNGEYIGKAEDY